MRRGMTAILIVVFIAVSGLSFLYASTIQENPVKVSFGFAEGKGSYEIGFSDSADNPSANQIEAIPLGLDSDGFGVPLNDVYVYWAITSTIPFRLSLSEAESGTLPLTVSWDDKESNDIIFESRAGVYSNTDAVKLSIKTVNNISELSIKDYSTTLVLSIMPAGDGD